MIAVRDGGQISLPRATHDALPVNGNSRRKLLPFATAWDAIGDLDNKNWDRMLAMGGKWRDLLPSIPEGANYKWHTPRGGGEPLFGWSTRYWSFLLKLAKDKPSWTLLAQPGSATGPFHWRNRKLSIEEMCRLQTFPRGYNICGSYRSAQSQVGNAVPSAIGELIGLEIRRQVFGGRPRRKLSLIPQLRERCPPSEPVKKVPSKYFFMRGDHPAHPGAGMGPSAHKRNTSMVSPQAQQPV
jgi:DNA (cytosine-5)-methyltransferase 1